MTAAAPGAEPLATAPYRRNQELRAAPGVAARAAPAPSASPRGEALPPQVAARARRGGLPPADAPRSTVAAVPRSGPTPWGTPSTTASGAPSSWALSDDEQEGSEAPRVWALRGGGEPARAWRVKNTLLELYLLEDCSERPRRARSAPPPARASGECQAEAASESSGKEQFAEVVSAPRVPTVGSALHMSNKCRPCAFVLSSGCTSGENCAFCHLCGPDAKKRRQRERWDEKRRAWRASKRGLRLAPAGR
ncbi:unnamed protein product [Prorocentrum cordatum]|nr:unnamed protein product [Polarella glacialis]